MFGNGQFRVARLNAKRGKQRRSKVPEVVIHKMRDATYVMFHCVCDRDTVRSLLRWI